MKEIANKNLLTNIYIAVEKVSRAIFVLIKSNNNKVIKNKKLKDKKLEYSKNIKEDNK